MRANLVLLVYFSMTASRSRVNTCKGENTQQYYSNEQSKLLTAATPLRNANCASLVIASASSRRTNLTEGLAL
jgi:hypothetical protein